MIFYSYYDGDILAFRSRKHRDAFVRARPDAVEITWKQARKRLNQQYRLIPFHQGWYLELTADLPHAAGLLGRVVPGDRDTAPELGLRYLGDARLYIKTLGG